MSLYYLSKLMYDLNRDKAFQTAFLKDRAAAISSYDLTAEERDAVVDADIGLLYVLGLNGQLLMHYAALLKVEWSEYLQRMRDGVKKHGPVRAGIYALTTSPDEKVAG